MCMCVRTLVSFFKLSTITRIVDLFFIIFLPNHPTYLYSFPPPPPSPSPLPSSFLSLLSLHPPLSSLMSLHPPLSSLLSLHPPLSSLSLLTSPSPLSLFCHFSHFTLPSPLLSLSLLTCHPPQVSFCLQPLLTKNVSCPSPLKLFLKKKWHCLIYGNEIRNISLTFVIFLLDFQNFVVLFFVDCGAIINFQGMLLTNKKTHNFF